MSWKTCELSPIHHNRVLGPLAERAPDHAYNPVGLRPAEEDLIGSESCELAVERPDEVAEPVRSRVNLLAKE